MEGRSLLISDVDNTLLGDDAALARLAEWLESARPGLRLVYSSGRFVDSVLESVRESLLPMPDAISGGVGTELRRLPEDSPFAGWYERFDGWDAGAVRGALAELPELAPQPAVLQSAWKVSYYAYDASGDLLRAVAKRLEEAGCKSRVIYSSRRDLDVLPAAAGKGEAARFLAEVWGFSREQVMVAGDSGNDLAMFEQGFRGIVVGNAHEELKSLAGDGVFHAEGEYAAGVLEGLSHWRGDKVKASK